MMQIRLIRYIAPDLLKFVLDEPPVSGSRVSNAQVIIVPKMLSQSPQSIRVHLLLQQVIRILMDRPVRMLSAARCSNGTDNNNFIVLTFLPSFRPGNNPDNKKSLEIARVIELINVLRLELANTFQEGESITLTEEDLRRDGTSPEIRLRATFNALLAKFEAEVQ